MPFPNLRRACRRFRCPYVPTCRKQPFVYLTFLTANELLMKRSTAIEMTAYETNGGTTSPAYRTKMRSLYLNLKGKENPSLREGVVSGDIPVAKLCAMASQVGVDADNCGPYHLQYLFYRRIWPQRSENKKTSRSKTKTCLPFLEQGSSRPKQMHFSVVAVNRYCDHLHGSLAYSKSHQRKTVYRQAQTRSADEPMTVSIAFLVMHFLLTSYIFRHS